MKKEYPVEVDEQFQKSLLFQDESASGESKSTSKSY